MTYQEKPKTSKDPSERDTSLSDGRKMEEWRTRSHLTVMVDNIPSHWMVADLKTFLDGFGNVVKLEIFEDRDVAALHPFFQHINCRLEKVMDMER